jgi:hypothetical protein
MSDNIDTRVSPALDPETYRAIEGLTEETAPFVGHVINAMNDAYVTVGKLHDARRMADSNGAWTEEQKILVVGKEAEKQKQRILKKIDLADRDLSANIAHVEAQLMEPLAERAGLGTLNGEVRAFVRGLNRSEREAFMRDALERADEATLTAVLGAQPFLSGLTPIDREHYLRQHHSKKRPDLVRRLDVMRRFADMLGRSGPIVHRQFEKAVGAKPAVVRAINEANAQAEAALRIEPTD